MEGKLYGVGTGPGDPELITMKAVRIIMQCPVIAVPISGGGECVARNIARQAVPSIEDKQILEVSMPMTRSERELQEAHEHAADLIINCLKDGRDVAFLTLGDPTIYSTYIYIHRLVRQRGYEAQIIPGVPSFCAVSSTLDDCLVETGQSLHVFPGAYGDIGALLKLSGTKVIMKSGKSFSSIYRELRADQHNKSIKIVENCGLDNERVFDTLEQAAQSLGYFSVIVVKD